MINEVLLPESSYTWQAKFLVEWIILISADHNVCLVSVEEVLFTQYFEEQNMLIQAAWFNESCDFGWNFGTCSKSRMPVASELDLQFFFICKMLWWNQLDFTHIGILIIFRMLLIWKAIKILVILLNKIDSFLNR